MLKKKTGEFLNLVICIISICFLLTYPTYCIEAAKDGLATALYIVLPSIFPFMVLARFIISSGVHYTVSEFIGSPFEKAFGVSKKYASVFILGCLGGYPIGSVILSNLLKRKEISAAQVEYLIGLCNNASPMFVIGTIGTLLLNNVLYGYILYIIHIFCICLCGITMKFIFNPKYLNNHLDFKNHKSTSPFSEAVTSSGLNMINITSYIIVFSVVSNFIVLFFKNYSSTFILCLLEITTGIKHCAQSSLPETLKLSLISSALGFSGFCVFSQIRSVCSDANISFIKYFFAKSLTAILSLITTYLTFTIIFSH